MDAKLAEIYGTNQVDETDIEKMAAAELAEELAENEEANIDGMSEEQIEALAEQVLAGDDSSEEYYEETEEGIEKESQEKLAEADYLGRVMAHAYVNELRGIEKEARWQHKTEAGKAVFKPGQGHKSKADRATAKQWATESNKGLNQKGDALKLKQMRADRARAEGAAAQKAKSLGGRMSAAKGKVMSALKGAGKHIGKHKLPYGLGAAGALAAGGAYMAGKRKESSALDTLAEQRALEILEENGIDLNETEKVSSANEYDVLAQAVEQRAFDLLAEAGYIETEEGEE